VRCGATIGTRAEELKQVVFDMKSGVTLKRVNQLTEIAFCEFGHAPTSRANNAMCMGVRAENVAVALTEAVDALHDAHIGIQLEGAEKAGVTEWCALVL